ncbi:unnamed protein product, partial [Ectocarpus fasciculatus]
MPSAPTVSGEHCCEILKAGSFLPAREEPHWTAATCYCGGGGSYDLICVQATKFVVMLAQGSGLSRLGKPLTYMPILAQLLSNPAFDADMSNEHARFPTSLTFLDRQSLDPLNEHHPTPSPSFSSSRAICPSIHQRKATVHLKVNVCLLPDRNNVQ